MRNFLKCNKTLIQKILTGSGFSINSADTHLKENQTPFGFDCSTETLQKKQSNTDLKNSIVRIHVEL